RRPPRGGWPPAAHPGRPEGAPADRPGARRSSRLPRHRPRDSALGPAHRRSAVRDRGPLEAEGQRRRPARKRVEACAPIPRRGGGLTARQAEVAESSFSSAVSAFSAVFVTWVLFLSPAEPVLSVANSLLTSSRSHPSA